MKLFRRRRRRRDPDVLTERAVVVALHPRTGQVAPAPIHPPVEVRRAADPPSHPRQRRSGA